MSNKSVSLVGFWLLLYILCRKSLCLSRWDGADSCVTVGYFLEKFDPFFIVFGLKLFEFSSFVDAFVDLSESDNEDNWGSNKC